MAPFYQRPENALKRAEELVAVNQNTSALELLHDVIMSKRSRSTPLTALEPIMLKFVELSVVLRKGKIAKEGLHQYKNISQNVTIATIELVIKRFIELSEAKVSESQAKADKITLDAVEDLEAVETPESIILSTVSGEVSKDRTDREVVTPWLKFLWEAYRTALDILRNNARLEMLYQTVANQAFKFCLKYDRKTEFRRLCELLRQHVATAAKYSHQAHAINLNDPDTLQRHLDTRFDQLNAAAKLDLWQEAFRSIEDIHNLLSIAKKPPKPFMMANYYEKLSKIFMKGDNYLFHAAAWSKYYATIRMNKNLPEEEHQSMASLVLLSALSVPIINSSRTRSMYSDSDESKPRIQRLSNLLRVPKPPTRESLIKEALNRTVLTRVRPELKQLYNILEVDFHPLSICKKVGPVLAALGENKDIMKYAKPLQEVILTRLLQQLSQVYTTITIDSVVSLATFSSSSLFALDEHAIEKLIMNGCRKGDLSMRVNHITKSITFEANLFSGGSRGAVSEGPKLQLMPSEHMRLHLSGLAGSLCAAVGIINPKAAEERREQKEAAFRAAVEGAEEERRKVMARRLLIEKKKELRENEAARKAREEQRAREIKLAEEAEMDKKRLDEEEKRRLEKQRQDQMEEIEKQRADDLKKQVAASGKGVDVSELEGLSKEELENTRDKFLEQERMEMMRKTVALRKRTDHTARAFRKHEIPLWEADYSEQKRVDRAFYDALTVAQQEAAAEKHRDDLIVKERLARMRGDYMAHREHLRTAQESQYKAMKAEAERKIEEAKKARILEVKKRKQEEVIERERAERDRIAREEEEERQRQAAEREAEAKAKRDAAKREEEKKRLEYAILMTLVYSYWNWIVWPRSKGREKQKSKGG
ncbi:eukaryotic translation initiation factor 3 subunit A [Irineochytrium annulatum]|nr:eukaryotic translation initiation factor 3 subunit A [Irineochytrium annulatum]